MDLNFSTISEKITELTDERIIEYPFMSSMTTPVVTLFVYVAFVLKIGPKFMENRPAFNLDKLVRVYNLAQIFLNGVLFVKALRHVPRMSVYCSPWDGSFSAESLDMLWISYFYTALKFVDLLDTVFFVLRKKYKQITFLHVYHHILMIFTTYICCKFLPGGLAYFILLPNTFAHCVMYYYYYLANRSPKGIWWKKYITVLQLCQHFFIVYVTALHLINRKCSYSKVVTFWCFLNSSIVTVLFLRFYFVNYFAQGKKKEKAI